MYYNYSKTLPITYLSILGYNYFNATGKKLAGSVFFYDHCGVDTDHSK